MPTNLVFALSSSVGRILAVGLNEWVRRRAALAARCREGLRKIGLEPVAEDRAQANLVVAAWADDPTRIGRYVADDTGTMISRGLEPLDGRTIRIGLMGRTGTRGMVPDLANRMTDMCSAGRG